MKFIAASLLAIAATAVNIKQEDGTLPPAYGGDMYGADMYGADMYGADMYGGDGYGADMYGGDGYGAPYGGDGYGGDGYGAPYGGDGYGDYHYGGYGDYYYGGYGDYYGGYYHPYHYYGGYGDYGHYYGGYGSYHGYGGGYDELPFEAPQCPERPSEEDMENATLEDVFTHVDTNENGAIDAQEGFNALYCMVEWGYMEEDEAKFMYEFLGDHANKDENGVPDELDMTEAQAAMGTLEKIHNLPECGEMPEGAEDMSP